MPYRTPVEHPQLCLAAAAASILLTLWALNVDPVVNVDGVLYIEAAERFATGQWQAGLSVYKWPFYSMLIAATSLVTGMAGGHAAYFLNAGLYVLAILGFIALVKVLGGSRRALWLAALVGLAHPTLNEFRSFIIRDVGYWACYLWTLALLLGYARNGDARLLAAGLLVAVGAFLFRIEGIMLVTVLPACIYLARSAHRGRAAAVLLVTVLVTAAAVAAAPLWHYVSEVNVATAELLASPWQHVTNSWALVGAGIDDRLQALQREFPGLGSRAAALPVYLLTVLAIILIELVKTVGIVFTGLIVYAARARRVRLPGDARRWWWLALGLQALLVLQFGVANFFLAERYPVALALTLLPAAPLVLDDLLGRARLHERRHWWRAALIAVLIAVETVEGLDIGTQKLYLKDAGLWLRANAPAGSGVYSNNRILIYYSGLRDAAPGGEHSWDAAMQEVWADQWQTYDYFAVVMTRSRRQHEVLLLRRMGADPIKTFENEDGDRVLIFRPG